MRKRNKFISKFLALCLTLLCFSSYSNIPVRADVDLEDWEMDIEKEIIEGYDIKSEEKNVEMLRDKDSKIGDVVEIIYEENTQSEKAGVALEQADVTKILTDDFTEQWATTVGNFALATGWAGGTLSEINANTSGTGFMYNLTNTGVHRLYKDEGQISKYISQFDANITSSREINVRNALGHPFVYIWCNITYKEIDGDAAYKGTIYLYQPNNPDFNKIYIMKNQHMKKTQILDLIEQNMNANKAAIVKGYLKNLKSIVGNTDSTKYYNYCYMTDYALDVLTSNVDSFYGDSQGPFDCDKTIFEPGGGYKWALAKEGKIQTLKCCFYPQSTSPDTIANKQSWKYFIYSCSALIDNDDEKFFTANGSLLRNNVYYQVRRDNLGVLIKKAYLPFYLGNFKVNIKNLDTAFVSKLHSFGYSNTNHKNLIYSGATFSGSNLPSTYWTLVTSGYYYQRGAPLKYGGTPLQSLTNAQLVDIFMSPKISYSMPSRYGTERKINAGEKATIKTYCQNALGTLLASGKITAEIPQRFDIKFDDSSITYQPYLTTSCIVNNPLNRYEFWLQNVSNPDDKTYYNKQVQLLPDETNKDGYLSPSKHMVELSPSDNWGTFLATRYKYMDYVYKVYYGFYGTSPHYSCKTESSLTDASFRGVSLVKWGANTKLDATMPQVKGNKYGWFWKFTYSEREFYGGYYVTKDEVNSAESTIKEHLMQNLGDTNEIVWLSSSEIGPSKWNNNQNIWDSRNNQPYQKGDIYRYKNAVRTETIYSELVVPYSVDVNGEDNATSYIIALGEGSNYDCKDTITLCDCMDENDGCALDKEELEKSAAITN